MTHRGVIFDMDGVLVDSYQAHFHSWQRMLRQYGLDMNEEQFAGTFGRTSRDILQNLWPGKVAESSIATMDAQKEGFYREILQKDFPEMPGASELIRRLFAAGFRMAIGSSGPPENVKVVHSCLPAGENISASVNGMEVRHGKPDPEVFLLAAKKMGVEPRRCAVVEDALMGLEAARRAGMVAIALTGTTLREQLVEKADLVVENLGDLTVETINRLIDRNEGRA
jgi:beta-phosphoglucomutase